MGAGGCGKADEDMMCESSEEIAGFVVAVIASCAVLVYLAYTIYDTQKFYKAAITRIVNGEPGQS